MIIGSNETKEKKQLVFYILFSQKCTVFTKTNKKRGEKSTLPVQINTKYDNGIYF